MGRATRSCVCVEQGRVRERTAGPHTHTHTHTHTHPAPRPTKNDGPTAPRIMDHVSRNAQLQLMIFSILSLLSHLNQSSACYLLLPTDTFARKKARNHLNHARKNPPIIRANAKYPFGFFLSGWLARTRIKQHGAVDYLHWSFLFSNKKMLAMSLADFHVGKK